MRRHPEQALQQHVARFLTVALTGDAYFSALPLGGGGRLRGAILKGMGTAKGLPDIIVLNEGRAIFLELKAPKGRVTEAQHECHAALKRAGCPVYVCRSIDDVERALRDSGVPLRIVGEAA